MNIPRDEHYPNDAVQCDGCGGYGCQLCKNKGWLPCGHEDGRICYLKKCNNTIPPSRVAVYCSNECATEDA